MSEPRAEMREILDAIREVETSLDRRAARADGAMMVVWGAVVAGIFLFYQLARWNHDAYHALFGPFLHWMWIPPTLLGYALTTVVGVRLGRALPKKERTTWWTWSFASIVPVAVVVVLLVAGEGGRVAGLWILYLGAMTALSVRGGAPSFRGSCALVAAPAIPVGAWLLLAPQPWGLLAAAAFYGIGLVGLGTVVYARG